MMITMHAYLLSLVLVNFQVCAFNLLCNA